MDWQDFLKTVLHAGLGVLAALAGSKLSGTHIDPAIGAAIGSGISSIYSKLSPAPAKKTRQKKQIEN